jgi:hypothetical protein
MSVPDWSDPVAYYHYRQKANARQLRYLARKRGDEPLKRKSRQRDHTLLVGEWLKEMESLREEGGSGETGVPGVLGKPCPRRRSNGKSPRQTPVPPGTPGDPTAPKDPRAAKPRSRKSPAQKMPTEENPPSADTTPLPTTKKASRKKKTESVPPPPKTVVRIIGTRKISFS